MAMGLVNGRSSIMYVMKILFVFVDGFDIQFKADGIGCESDDLAIIWIPYASLINLGMRESTFLHTSVLSQVETFIANQTDIGIAIVAQIAIGYLIPA